jgi:hypothetical protein
VIEVEKVALVALAVNLSESANPILRIGAVRKDAIIEMTVVVTVVLAHPRDGNVARNKSKRH